MIFMNPEKLNNNLKFIRSILDVEVTGVDMTSLVEHGKRVAQLAGLAAECKAMARKQLEQARLIAITKHSGKVSPSILLKMADGECAQELAVFEYADRLCAGISHNLDYFRSVISLHKEELNNLMK